MRFFPVLLAFFLFAPSVSAAEPLTEGQVLLSVIEDQCGSLTGTPYVRCRQITVIQYVRLKRRVETVQEQVRQAEYVRSLMHRAKVLRVVLTPRVEREVARRQAEHLLERLRSLSADDRARVLDMHDSIIAEGERECPSAVNQREFVRCTERFRVRAERAATAELARILAQ